MLQTKLYSTFLCRLGKLRLGARGGHGVTGERGPIPLPPGILFSGVKGHDACPSPYYRETTCESQLTD